MAKFKFYVNTNGKDQAEALQNLRTLVALWQEMCQEDWNNNGPNQKEAPYATCPSEQDGWIELTD